MLQNQQELNVMNQLKLLRERIDKEGASIAVQKLISLMESLKVCRLSVQWVYSEVLLKCELYLCLHLDSCDLLNFPFTHIWKKPSQGLCSMMQFLPQTAEKPDTQFPISHQTVLSLDIGECFSRWS